MSVTVVIVNSSTEGLSFFKGFGFLNPSVVRILAAKELYKARPNSFLVGESPLYCVRHIIYSVGRGLVGNQFVAYAS